MQHGDHIVSAFDTALESLSGGIAEMGAYAEELIAQVIEALETNNGALAAEVIAADQRLDDMEHALDGAAVEMLALRQPMAADLRETICALKVASTLERVGDLAKSVARRVQILPSQRHDVSFASTLRMGRRTLALFSEAMEACAARDSMLALSVRRRDVEIDATYNSVFRELTSYMMEEPRRIELCAQLLFIAKNFERIGDHATFVAEMVYYVVEGRHLEDERPKGPLPRFEDHEEEE